MAVRTRFLDVFFADATTAGIRQGVILRSTRVAYSANGFELPDDDMMTALAGDSGYLSAVLN